MVSKFQQKTKLMTRDGSKYTTKQFMSAEFLSGSATDTGMDLQIRLEEVTKTNDMEAIRSILRGCYGSIADVIFEKRFIGQEYIDGMDVRELLKIIAQSLGSVTPGYDVIYSEQKKK